MSKCPTQEDVFLYSAGELPQEYLEALARHLETCPACRRELDEFQAAERYVIRNRRPAPPAPLRRAYRRALKRRFGPAPRTVRARTILSNLGGILPTGRPAILPLARSVAVLMIGVLIGRFLLLTPHFTVRGDRPFRNVSPAQLQQLDAFMTKSEIWLLTVMNDPRGRDASDNEFRMNRDMARQLLSEALLIEQEAVIAENDDLVRFINQMELLLLEAANAEERVVGRVFDEIGRTIQDTELHIKTRELQTELKGAVRKT